MVSLDCTVRHPYGYLFPSSLSAIRSRVIEPPGIRPLGAVLRASLIPLWSRVDTNLSLAPVEEGCADESSTLMSRESRVPIDSDVFLQASWPWGKARPSLAYMEGA